MSFIKLNSGKFVVIDTVPLDDSLKMEINNLTENGNLIEAVVATHPFHTLAFPDFYAAYPNPKYYGTPRHLRNLTQIKWEGDISQNLNLWSPEIEMRIPEGAEFNAPEPESFNHFSSVWVYHPASFTLHVDDTINYYPEELGGFLGVVADLLGKTNTCSFHPSIEGPALYPTAQAPLDFQRWVTKVTEDWPFENICTAHVGVRIGGGNALVRETIEKNKELFEKLSTHVHTHSRVCSKEKHIKDSNVNGHECG